MINMLTTPCLTLSYRLASVLPSVPQSSVESYLTTNLGVSGALVRFFLVLIGSVLSGCLVRCVHGTTARHTFSGITGILLLYFNLGGHIIHSILVSLATYMVLLVAPRRCSVPVWTISFTYLTFLHVAKLGASNYAPAAQNFINGAQMMLTLKLISLAMCLQDGCTKKARDMSAYQMSHSIKQPPSLLEYLGFVYCLGSLIVGPVMEFRDYQLWARREGPWDPSTTRKARRGDIVEALKSGLTSVASLVFFLSLDKHWSPRVVLSAWYRGQPLLHKLMVMQVVGVTYRSRYYFIWAMSRAAMAVAGLDFIKWDEEKQRGAWGRCCNAYPLTVELADSGRLMGNNWNITTATFMRRYVFERVGEAGRLPGTRALLVTYFVSCTWHGLNSGYYLFYVGWTVFAMHSTVIHKYEQAYLPTWFAKSWPWWMLKVLVTQQCSVFLLQPFALLTWRESIAAWGSVYYLPLVYMAIVMLIGRLFPVRSKLSGAGSCDQAGNDVTNRKHNGRGGGSEQRQGGTSSAITAAEAAPAANGHPKEF